MGRYDVYHQKLSASFGHDGAMCQAILSTGLVRGPLRKATPHEDRILGVDYYDADGNELAFRVRNLGVDHWLRRTMALRITNPEGHTTELEKLMAGRIRYYVTGFLSSGSLEAWHVVDADLFRSLPPGQPLGTKPLWNKDGDALFVNYFVFDEPGLVVASSGSF